MIIDIKIPGAGESVTEAAIGNWLVKDGDMVEKDQELAEVETDKATLPLIATDSGKIKIMAMQGLKIQVGQTACTIDTDAKAEKRSPEEKPKAVASSSPAAATAEEHVQPTRPEPPPAGGIPPVAGPAQQKSEIPHKVQPEPDATKSASTDTPKNAEKSTVKVTPVAKNMMHEYDLDVQSIIDGLRRITRSEVEQVIHHIPDENTAPASSPEFQPDNRSEQRVPMSPLRRKLSKRLVTVKNETAMLTTFNEVDMSQVLEIRKKYNARFQEKHQQKLGMMSFFIKASAKALQQFPGINSFLDNEDIVTPGYIDIAVAVQTEKGLMVPVIRNVHHMNIAQIETSLSSLASKARSFKLSLDEMTGGTFTITNGGVFGSMLSTPILNPPQSAILGMHNIIDRPVAINGKIEIRPIMYVALSYDHRVVDGRESVSFLVKIKEMIESPIKMLIDGDPEQLLLGL